MSQKKESKLLEILAAVIDSFKSVRVGYMVVGSWAAQLGLKDELDFLSNG